MDQVTNRLPPGFVWPTVGHPGLAPIDSMIGDPGQPRKWFDDFELKALAETMKSENGGHVREIVTVREFSPAEQELHGGVRYQIKSGERRWRAAKLAGIAMLEIRVKEYVSRAEEKLDMYMLNNGRVGLSDIENAWFLADLMEEFDWTTHDELSKATGESKSWVAQHLSLLSLSPKVQDLMHPRIPEHDRLKRGVGVYLSRFNFAQQNTFVDGMPKDRATASQQIRWMQDQLKGTGEELPQPKFKPATLRRIVSYFADQAKRRAGEILSNTSLDKLFHNAKPEQVADLLNHVHEAQNEFATLVAKVEEFAGVREKAADDAKAKAAAFIERRSQEPPAKKEEAARPEPPKPPAAPAPKPAQQPPQRAAPAPTRTNPGSLGKRAESADSAAAKKADARLGPMMGTGFENREKTVIYHSDAVNRRVTGKVNRRQYIDLFNKGKFAFQLDSKPRPDWMPTPSEAANNWKEYCD